MLDSDADHVLAHFRNVLILVWRCETRARDIEAARVVLARLISEHAEGVAIVQIIEPAL